MTTGSSEAVIPKESAEVGSSWVWLLILFTVASLVDAAFYGQVGAFTPLHLGKLGLSPEEVTRYTGLLAAMTWAVGIPFLPFWGALADRYSRQPIIVRSFAAFLVAGVLMLIARDIWLFGLGRALMSLALGNSGLMMTTLAERVPKHRLGLAFAIMNSAAPIGYFAGPLGGGPIVDRWGLSGLLLINMALIVLVILGLSFGYRDTYHGKATGSIWKMAGDSIVPIARSSQLRTLFAALFTLLLGWQAALTYIPLAVTNIYHGSDPGTAVGIVVGVGGLAVMVVGPVVGALADRYGRWRMLFIGALVAAALLPLPMFARSVPALAASWGAANAMLSSIFALSFTVISEATTGEMRARVMSFAYLPAYLSNMTGAAIGSFIAGYSVWWIFPIGALLTMIGVGVLWWASRLIRPKLVTT